ncbi:cytochrome P450 [Choanephora cucurbitarum]|nr:cytochrome P450 [Choanephora cucurbitarum]
MLAVLSVILLGFIGNYCYQRYRSPLASAPIAITNNPLVQYFGLVPPPKKTDQKDHISEFLIRIGQDPRLSPVAVCWSIFGTPLVFVNTLKGIKDVLIDGQARVKGEEVPKVQRGNLIRLIQNLVFGGPSLNNQVGKEWRWRRHILLPSFQPKQLVPKLLPYVASRTQRLMDLFGEQADKGTCIELDDIFMDLTMDVINYYLYGREALDYDIVNGRRNLKYEHEKLGLGFQSIEAWLPFGINKTDWAQRAFKPSRDKLKMFIGKALDGALADYDTMKADYDANQVPAKDRSYPSVAACAYASGQYNRTDLINDLLSLTFAGYDTTAHTLAFTFSELARNRTLQDALFEQVRQVLGPPPVAADSITADKLARMPLVTAVYRETLRKYPAVVFIPVHVNRDTVVDGVVVPGGAEVWCNVRGIQMNPAIFPDPDQFDPTRWLRPDEEDHAFDSLSLSSGPSETHITPETQYKFPDLPFTMGPHACIGKNLAILELRTVIACTMNEFVCRLKEGSQIDTKVVLTTKPRYGVHVYFERRK